ncbi:MAG: hypothetical protein MK358_14040, partial [Vicinamibacterales bacterium]|nr:hypothetical protein [Vicinamibacterales bacterium]
MTSRIDGQTDEQAEGDAIGSGKSGLERVLGLAQRRSSPNSRTPDGVRDINAWILPEGGYAGTRRTRRCSRAKA